MGITDLSGRGDNVQRVEVEEYFVHPDYEWSDNNNDIALVKLKTPFRITDYVRTICEPEPGMEFPVNTSCWATGWGATPPGGRS